MDNKKIAYILAALLVLSIACSSFSVSFSIDPTQTDSPSSDPQGITTPTEPVDQLGKPEATEPATDDAVPSGGGQFSNADEVIDDPPDSNVFTSPAGQLYIEVRIKAGPKVITFTEDTQDGCLEVLGFGTSTMVINRVGSGKNCKEIGGIGLYYGE